MVDAYIVENGQLDAIILGNAEEESVDAIIVKSGAIEAIVEES